MIFGATNPHGVQLHYSAPCSLIVLHADDSNHDYIYVDAIRHQYVLGPGDVAEIPANDLADVCVYALSGVQQYHFSYEDQQQ